MDIFWKCTICLDVHLFLTSHHSNTGHTNMYYWDLGPGRLKIDKIMIEDNPGFHLACYKCF